LNRILKSTNQAVGSKYNHSLYHGSEMRKPWIVEYFVAALERVIRLILWDSFTCSPYHQGTNHYVYLVATESTKCKLRIENIG